MKRFVYLLLALLIMSMFVTCVSAAPADKGSVTVSVKYEDSNVTGGDLVAVRVGYVDYDEGVFRKFVTNDEITKLGEAGTVAQIQNFHDAYKSICTFDEYKAEISDGVAKFTELPQGLYLVYQTKAAKGFDKLSAFLVTVPYENKLDVTIAAKPELNQEAKPTTEPSDPTTTPTEPNKPPAKLPQSGQLTWPVPVMAVAGMTLFVLGWWQCFGRKEDSQ